MHIPKTLLAKYNKVDSVIMISPFPQKGVLYGEGIGGLASFAKNVIKSLARHVADKKKVIVFAHMINGKEEIYEEHGYLVVRCFERDTFNLYAQLINQFKPFDKVKNVSIQFEFAAYGGFFVASFFPILLSALRAQGKHISVVLHQVVTDLEELAGHVGMRPNSLQLKAFNFLLCRYYQVLGHTTNRVITLEESLKDRLSALVKESKIVAIPHGVDTSRPMVTKDQARKQLGLSKKDIVLISFGYLTWYKGSDLLAQSLAKIQEQFPTRKVKLILAGGKSETLSEKAHYKAFLKKIDKVAKTSSNITVTGFVKEEDIAVYYGAADLVLFPYRTFMSSSGPLSLAFSYQKPFLLSQPLSKVLLAPDYVRGLAMAGISSEDICMPLRTDGLAKAVISALESSKYTKIHNISMFMRNERSYKTLAKQYETALFTTEEQKHWIFNFRFLRIYPKVALPVLALVCARLFK